MKERFLQPKWALHAALLVLLLSAGGMTKALAQPTGAINGLFSVGENTQVYFSQGNLQYQASTNTWRFAENQWDYMGDGNANISSTYDGWIDLFNWGTSGYNHGANCYQPWSTSESSSDYYAYGISTYSLNDSTGMADWGYNAISNGGNQEKQWYVLSYDEWNYVLFERETSSGIRFARAKVNGINGVIILSDNWDASNYSLNNTNVGSASYNQNSITSEDWINFFQETSVFLPCAGNRGGTYLYNSDNGDYWSSTRKMDDDFAYDISIQDAYFGHSTSNGGYAQSVRLVRPAQANTSYSIEAVPNPAAGGTITGTGIYDYYAQVTLTANANEGYTFYQWKENGNIISSENPYSFVALFDRNLEACFLENNTYPLLYSYNDDDHTATVTGRWDGVQLEGELVIPETVMHNGESYTVTAIGSNAFYGCSGLTSVVIPNTMISIGEYAFSECSFTSVVFPNSLNFIENWAFRYCNGLTEVVIPSSVTSIGVNPFTECSNLAQITVESGNAYYDSRDNSNAIIQTSTNCLISGSLSGIIPSSVTSLGQDAFYMESITSITSFAEIPPTLNVCSFCGVNRDIPVYVPCASIEAYPNADGWNEFTNFIELCPGQITVTASPVEGGTVSGGGSFEGGETCTVTATPNEGYYFECWKENGRRVSTEATYSFMVAGNRNLTANFYTSQPGMINGLFSVGESQMICFSQGNLQYQASTNTWRFADNQWDYVGEDNNNASSTYDGWIDLYQWGTSGYDHGANLYLPWSNGGWNYDWAAYGNDDYDLCDGNGQADWGYNAISNGGNQERVWRTCRTPEWQYLLETRQTTSGIRFAKASVNGVNGLIILPDNWNSSIYDLNNANDGSASYDTNVISLDDWSVVLETNGAVFLPASGRIQDWANNDFGEVGMYWSATHGGVPWMKCLVDFSDSGLNTGGSYYPDERYSVRLVRPVSGTTYSIEAVSNPTEGGTVSGTGTYDYYTTATLTAIPNEGYSLYRWREHGNVVSTDSTYSVVALFDRSLEACFLETSTYPLVYSFNDSGHTATVTGHWDGQNATGDLVILETVMHNGEVYTVTAIGDNALRDCSNLTSVELPNSLISIGGGAFWGCSGLNSVELPNSLVSIGNEAFRDCSGFTEIVIPSSVTSIGEVNPFGGCSNLAQITVESGNAYYDSRENCNAIIETATNKLVSGSLSTVIPNMVTSIGWNAFYGILVSSITISESVNYIGVYAIADVNTLSSITLLAEVPPTLGDCSFCGSDNSTSVLVPCGSLEAYQNAEGWRDYGGFAFIEMCPSQITVTASPAEGGTVTGAGTYNFGTVCTLKATANAGYIFINWTENGEVVSTEDIYSFTVTGDRSLVANFFDLHWTPNTIDYEENMPVTAVVEIDGVEQQSTTLELGAFSGEECRGSQMAMYFEPTQRYIYQMTVFGEEGDEITFRLYDHVTNEELDLVAPEAVTFNALGYGTLPNPIVLNFRHSYDITATANPEEGGTVNGGGTYFQGETATLTATANTGYHFVNWTKDGEIVPIEATYSFEVTGGGDYVANFALNTYEITATANPDNGGTITGAGIYEHFSTCTLTATPNTDCVFVNWTLNGEVVSTEAEYSFEVTGGGDYVANFDLMQTTNFSNGWNWWSTYIEQDGAEGLTMLENSLGSNGIIIKSQNAYVANTEGNGWYGTLTELDNESSFRVKTNTACTMLLQGDLTNPANHPMTLNSGWTWMGFPWNQAMSVEAALEGFEPEANDFIKGRNAYTMYYAENGYNMWFGPLNSLEPGQGYAYYSNSSEAKTLTLNTNGGRSAEPNVTTDDNLFRPEAGDYADNMTLTAVVDFVGMELRSENYEVAAFCNGECRGSAKLTYFAPTDSYIAFLTLFGNNGDELEFILTDADMTALSGSTMCFATDGRIGTLSEPYTLCFGFTDIDDNAATRMSVYPNPSKDVFNVKGEGIRRIDVFNAFGQVVVSEQAETETYRIDLSGAAAGVYLLRVVTESGVLNQQLIKE